MTYQAGADNVLRPGFIANGILNNTVDSRFRAVGDMWPVFAFVHDLGVVGATKTTPAVYAVGHAREPLVQLLNIPRINAQRSAYYFTRYNSIPEMVCLFYPPHMSDIYLALPSSLRSSMISLTLWRARLTLTRT